MLILLLLVIAIRYIPNAGEWYATTLYPTISYVLSLVASVVPFSLEEIIVVGGVLFLAIFPFWKSKGFKTRLVRFAESAAWIYVWFYLGWACNYYRADFYTRMDITPSKFEKAAFVAFLNNYTDSLNYYSSLVTNTDSLPDYEEEIKSIYRTLPSSAGLCTPRSFQHPKTVLINRLYSSVGVLGYMGPFMAESQLNHQLLPLQHPFVYAHELSHLLGISNEAEANYWAYRTCRLSSSPFLRYTAYYNLLPNINRNAYSLLSQDEYNHWHSTINPLTISQLTTQRHHWLSLRSPLLDQLQSRLYNWFLKSNRISSGTKNYDQVVNMIMSVER